MVDEHVSDQNGPIWLYATSGGPCFLSLGLGWLKRTKYGMDWLSGVSTHGWLTHCPLLTCPLYCGFFQSWPHVFATCICAFYIQQGFYCKVKYPQLHTVIKTTPNPSLWPTWCPHVAPCIVPSRHMLPVALFCSDNSSKGIKETRFPCSASAF